ncbi:ankyrin repeat domain-containing protein [Oscillospiraceae bacterium MB08-C2-2]|nr:ankyrin repeat domain-containing protein [Oscillospiraceae bacterium MB08-C2-2]
MKKLFVAIRQNDLIEVQRILEKNPGLVNCVAKSPPKSDDGQSPLQVAIKRGGGFGDTKIISYLLDMGADVNFIEDDKGLRPQEIVCFPVLMDMVRAVYSQATLHSYKYSPEETRSKTKKFIELFAYMLQLGADPNKMDNRLRPVWTVAICEGYKNSDEAEYQIFLADVTTQLMDLMITHGANIYRFSGSFPKEDLRYTHLYPFVLRTQILVNNLVFNRELTHGFSAEDEVNTDRPWIEFMKPYYAKDNPYYGAIVSEERKAFINGCDYLL